ncbi:MAG: XRE family transcriptional regulator [Candidatus Binatia bacterium]
MATKLKQVLVQLSPDRRKRIESRYRELKQEVESLGELRQLAGKVQADVAVALRIKQPSVSKIEKQADMYLSTLRTYVEAIGGTLELTVKLPKQPVLRLQHLGKLPKGPSVSTKARPRVRKSRSEG